MPAGTRTLVIAVVLVALWSFSAVPAAAAAPADAPAVAQEVTLDGLGIGAQAVYAAHGMAEAYLPAPAAPLAPTGTFVRVFFLHSQDIGAGSTMLVGVDGQPLLTVALDPGTAAGGVVEARVPVALLDQRLPTRLEVRFDLRAAVGSEAALYGEVSGQTMFHYQLATTAPPSLDALPFTVVPAGAAQPMAAVLLPGPPGVRDLAAAFRVVAGIGRRTPSRHLRPEVVTSDQVAWLASGGRPAILVGRLGSLPAAPAVLLAAGWKQSSGSWFSPDGRPVGDGDGLLLAATSPWDHRTPLLLVTGRTAAAVDRAAAVAAGGEPVPAGPYEIVSDAGSQPGSSAPPASGARLRLAGPPDLAPSAPGRYRVSASFSAPAVEPAGTAVLDLSVPGLTSLRPGTMQAEVNGSRVATATLRSAGSRPSELTIPFWGSLLRPGQDSLSLDFRLDAAAEGSPAPARTVAIGGDDSITATISFPSSPEPAADLRLLPFPFLEGGSPQLVLADATTGTLGAAALAMAALGSRSAEPPPAVQVVFARDWKGSPIGGTIVVGRPPGGRLDATLARLPVAFDASGSVRIGGSTGAELVQPATGLGAVQETGAAGGSGPVLWLDATDAAMLSRAAGALYDSRLSGSSTVVDASGRLTSVAGAVTAPRSAPGPGTPALAIAVAAALLAGVLALQLVRPRRPAP